MPVFLSLAFFSTHEFYALEINLLKENLSVICLTQKWWIFLGKQSIFQDWNQYFEIEINISRLKSIFQDWNHYFEIEMTQENWCFCSTVHTQNLPHTLSFSTPPHIYLLLYMSLPTTYHPYCCKTICRLSLKQKNLLKFKKHNFFVRRKSAQIVWWKKN